MLVKIIHLSHLTKDLVNQVNMISSFIRCDKVKTSSLRIYWKSIAPLPSNSDVCWRCKDSKQLQRFLFREYL